MDPGSRRHDERWYDWRLGLRRLPSRCRTYFRLWTVRTPPQTQLFVLATARSGSHLLTSYLKSLPGVSMRGEILNPGLVQGLRPGRTRHAVHRHIRASVGSLDTPVGGVKILLEQLALHRLEPQTLSTLVANPRFLILYRRSLAEQYVSLLIAEQTGTWNRRHDQPSERRAVTVDADAFRAYCQEQRARYSQVLAIDEIRTRAELVPYEALANDAPGLFQHTVCPFLGIAPRPVQTAFTRQNPQPLSEKVENYAQVRGVLHGSDACQDYAAGPSPVASAALGTESRDVPATL